jgi:hypothetical protein
MIRDVHPGSGSRFFSIQDPGSMGQDSTGSRIQGSKKHLIPDPDPKPDAQHWLLTENYHLFCCGLRIRIWFRLDPRTRIPGGLNVEIKLHFF